MRASRVQSREWEHTLTVKCRFCGGSKCRRCSRQAALGKKDSPILGLHADWVTSHILGMMRPATKLIQEFDILNQFIQSNIKAVVNVTLPGEHPYCGEGLESSGFPYNPEDLMAKGIQFYNFGWEDMTVPTTAYMMNIVKVTASILDGGEAKIAVHCHAGYGRTGLVIACTIMFMHNISPHNAINIVRSKRPGSIQTQKQEAFVHKFHKYMQDSQVTYAVADIHEKFTLTEALDTQNRQLRGPEAIKHMYIPKVVEELCRRLESFATNDPDNAVSTFVEHVANGSVESADNPQEEWKRHASAVLGVPITADRIASLQFVPSSQLSATKIAINRGQWDKLDSNSCDVARMLLDWLDHLKTPLVEPYIVARCMDDYSEKGIAWKTFESQSKGILRTVERIAKCYGNLYACSGNHASAVLTRSAASLLHLDVHSIDQETMKTYTTFVKELMTSWKAPRAIEIDLEKIRSFQGNELPIFDPKSKEKSIIQLPTISSGSRHRIRPIKS